MMALTVIRKIAATVAGIKFVAMVDETTDVLIVSSLCSVLGL